MTEQSESNYDPGPSGTEALRYLDQQWEKLDLKSSLDSTTGKDIRTWINDIPNFRTLTPVHGFIESVLRGCYPTPELMLSIAKSFDLYLTAAGELSLEEVFFGKPRKRAGKFSERSIKDNQYLYFHDTVRREKALSQVSPNINFSLTELADKFLMYEYMDDDGNVGHYDINTFLRGHPLLSHK